MRRLGWVLALLLGWTGSAALAAPVPQDLVHPQRLTAGDSNQYVGTRSDREDALYFVSDVHVSSEVFVQSPVTSAPRRVLDLNADISNPAIDPAGRKLAYISYRSDSAGDVCIVDLETLENQCETGLEGSELHVQWDPDGASLWILRKTGMHGAMRLVKRVPGEATSERVVLERDMIRPSVHPGGEWIAFVPLQSDSDLVGVSFSQQRITGLALHHPAHGERLVKPDLPGVSSFPAFGRAGKYLYFVQYLNDTNGDGEIDGNDNGVIFRMPFRDDSSTPVDAARPEQLTSAAWNCVYPTPSPTRLLLTCTRESSLDLYDVPVTGMIPLEWDRTRLQAEANAARSIWTRLLLLGRISAEEISDNERWEVFRQMASDHLELGEFASALFYARQIQAEATAETPLVDWARGVELLALHRRDNQALSRGLRSAEFIRLAQKRLDELSQSPGSGFSREMRSAVAGMIELTLGRREAGAERMKGISLESMNDPVSLMLVARLRNEMHRQNDQPEGIVEDARMLSSHPALSLDAHLRYADAYRRAIFRGRSGSERKEALEGALGSVSPDSALGFVLQIHQQLLQLDDQREEEVREALFQLYTGNKEPEKRRFLALTAVRQASDRDNEYIQYQFANTWASGVKKSDPERKFAEALFEQVVLERAYLEGFKGEMGESRGYFFATTLQTGSLEGHIGFIEAWIAEGRKDIEGHYAKQFKRNPEDPTYGFVRAYLRARDLRNQESRETHDARVKEALAALAPAAEAFPRSVEVHHLWGTLLHQRYMMQGDRRAALDALNHYNLAADLGADRPRYWVATLVQRGMLQAALGNHRLALRDLEERALWPFTSAESHLNLQVALARSFYHVGEPSLSLAAIADAEKILAETPGLKRHRLLVLSQKALAARDGERWELAQKTYREVDDLLAGASDKQMASMWSRIRVRLGEASSALGGEKYEEALTLLDEVDRWAEAVRGEESAGDVRPILSDVLPFGVEEVQRIAWGLRAHANAGVRRYDAASRAMKLRRASLEARFSSEELDEDLLELAYTEYQLAQFAAGARRIDAFDEALERGLVWLDRYRENTGTPSGVLPLERRLLQEYAEAHLVRKRPLEDMSLDLRKRLEVSYASMCTNPSPEWAADRRLFGVYLALLDLE